jgi:hypothetical protein
MKKVIGIDKRGQIRFRNSKRNKVMTNGTISLGRSGAKNGKKRKRR